MERDLLIELQKLVWDRFRIEVPAQELLLQEFSEANAHLLPSDKTELTAFVNGVYAKFLEPLPGFIRSHAYLDEKLKSKGIRLKPVEDAGDYFFDPVNKMYWLQRYSHQDVPWGYYFEGPRLIKPFLRK